MCLARQLDPSERSFSMLTHSSGTCQIRTLTAGEVVKLKKGSRLRLDRVEQGFGLFEIGRAEAVCEPVVDRSEQVAYFDLVTLVTAKPREAHSGAQFPELGLLLGAMLNALQYGSPAGAECPCRSSNWPLCLFSSAANQRSPVLSTICRASSTRIPASSCPFCNRSGVAAQRPVNAGVRFSTNARAASR
jgi:hypothetical protein